MYFLIQHKLTQNSVILALLRWLILLSVAVICSSHAEQASDEQLKQVQQQIAQQQQKITATNKKRAKLEQKLKQDELAIAEFAKKLNATKAQLKQTQQQITDLVKQQKQLLAQQQQQQQLLAKQLRSAYSTGQHDYLKLLLNQTDAAKVQRALSYYQYLNKARVKEIDNLTITVNKLLKVKQQLEQNVAQLEHLKVNQQTQQQRLAQNTQKRQTTLKSLRSVLQTEQQNLTQLKQQEDNLVQALQALAEAAKASLSFKGLAKLKHQLNWPTNGRLLKRFGSKKQGYLRWKGVLISAPVGHTVTAVQTGKVLFSDWLNGYGLVTVVDHGEGYMSLYGHNQALLKNVGDIVETGEPIALVGQSGGQLNSGVYFEIRHNGKAMNPKLWCQ